MSLLCCSKYLFWSVCEIKNNLTGTQQAAFWYHLSFGPVKLKVENPKWKCNDEDPENNQLVFLLLFLMFMFIFFEDYSWNTWNSKLNFNLGIQISSSRYFPVDGFMIPASFLTFFNTYTLVSKCVQSKNKSNKRGEWLFKKVRREG